MRALQKRLEETEAQMTRILQAMQSMQTKMTTAVAEDVPMDEGIENIGANISEPQVGIMSMLLRAFFDI